MPAMWMDVDTALAAVPVNIVPLIDDTDFKTREESVAYNASGMDLVWNFVTSAGAYTQTAVTPTTAGDYDWTNKGNGMYSIEIPASGGASINNDTEGYGWFTGVATGVMPWTGPVIGFRAAAVNDALCDGGDLLDVNTTQVGGTTQTARDLGASVLLSSGTGAGQISLSSGAVLLQATQTGVTIPTVTDVTNLHASAATAAAQTTAQNDLDILTGTDGVTLATSQPNYAPNTATPLDAAGVRSAIGMSSADLDTQLAALPTAAENADAVLDEALSGHTTAGSLGKAVADIETDAAAILVDTGTTLPATLSTIAGYIDTEVAAIKAVTDNLPDSGALTSIAQASALATVDTVVDNLNLGIIYGSAATGTLSTTQATTDLTGYADDQLIGRVIIWTSGACEGEGSAITDYASTGGLLTFTALTTAPANGDTFKIV